MESLVNALANLFCIPLLRQVQYLADTESNMANLKRCMEELNVCEDEVQEFIRMAAASSAAEVKPMPRVSFWMEKVQMMKDEVLKIDNCYNTRETYLGGCPVNCWSSWRISKRAAKAAIRVREISSQRQYFPSSLTMIAARNVQRMRTLQDGTVSSTECQLPKIFDYLRNGEGMLGIWGMGGVGKTTLLRRIHRHPSDDEAGYDHVIWAVASQELSLDRLRTDIAKTVGLNLDTGTSHESPAELLCHFLSRKRFLLLLDDIWEPFDLRDLGIAMGKVVFTTRSEAVCDQMMASQSYHQMSSWKIKLECLQQEEAWKLFLHNIGLSMRCTISSDERVRYRAHLVANKCGGLPLALVVIAHAMSASKTWQEWEDTINSLDEIGVPEMWSRETDPFPLLKVSYDRLPNDNMKRCFLCCALWPKDHNIWKTDLINCWLGMNLISDCRDIGAAYSRGYTIIECLKRASLLEEVKDTYETTLKMHDVIRGMAQWIMSDSNLSDMRWTVLNGAEMTGRSEDLHKWRESKAISLVYGWLGTLPQQPCCPNLLALMLQRNHILSVIPDGFFQNMIALRYLDLSNTGIVDIPPAIGTLLQLQFLNVSCTSIKSLPMELAGLGKLVYFVASYLTHLYHIPGGLLYSLEKLELLDLRNTAYDGWEMAGEASMSELNPSIQALGIDIRRLETAEQLSKYKRMSPWWLILKDFNGVTTLPLTQLLLQIGNSRETLRELEIWFCTGLFEIVIGSNHRNQEFHNVELLRLLSLQKLMKITWSGAPFPNIRVLSIRACASLQHITWILKLRYLESLDIQECDKMEVVIANEGDQITFSHLKRLQLAQLPELCSFSASPVAFPHLIYISIDWCPKLDESPFSELKIRRIYQDEYDGTRFGSPSRDDRDSCDDDSFTIEGR